MANKMEQVVLLDKAYKRQIPYDFETVRQLSKINTKLKHIGGISIDDIVKRQSANGYLALKQVTILYPASSRILVQIPHLVFPYNMDPDYSVSILSALQMRLPEKQPQLQFDTQVEDDFKEKQLIDLVNEYIISDTLSFSDSRGYHTYDKLRKAKKFLKAYESLRAAVEKNPNGTYRNLLLALVFSATYEGIQRLLRDHKAEFESIKIADEFLHKQAETVDLQATLNGKEGKPLKRYWTKDEMGTLDLRRLWDFEKSIPNPQFD